MKALELVVYHRFEDRKGEPWHVWEDTCVRPYITDMMCESKRLTGAELAAEYYRASFLHENSVAENDGYGGMPETQTHRRQCRILHRFATLPSYDDTP